MVGEIILENTCRNEKIFVSYYMHGDEDATGSVALAGRDVSMGKSEKKRGFNWFVPILALIVLYFSSILISQQLYLNQVSRDQAASDARLQAARQENEALLQEKEKLNDADYIERVAREELGMTKAGEIPYSMVKKDRN